MPQICLSWYTAGKQLALLNGTAGAETQNDSVSTGHELYWAKHLHESRKFAT